MILGFIGATTASAQVIGTFPWRMAPYCNVVTLTVTQVPAGYTMDGFDDMCGAGRRVGATGQASLNPDGTIGATFTLIASPVGKGVQVAAVLSLVTLSGTWSDSLGSQGDFQFGGSSPGFAAQHTKEDIEFKVTGTVAALPVPSGASVRITTFKDTADYITGRSIWNAVCFNCESAFEVRVPGTYLITASVDWGNFPNSTGYQCVTILTSISGSGSEQIGITCNPTSTAPFSIPTVTAVAKLTPGTLVSVAVVQHTGASVNLPVSNNSHLSVIRLR